MYRAELKGRGLWDEIADLAQEHLISGSIMRMRRTPVVPRVDLDLQILALDEQRRILRREFAGQPGEIAPGSVGVESRPRQCTLFDEIGQSRIDGQAGAVEKFGHASTL